MKAARSPGLDLLRVDLVGSLLRPEKLKQAFVRFGRGEAGEEELRQVQDESIREAVGKQVARNLPVVTDGEFRRTNFMESFSLVAGVEEWQSGVKSLQHVLARHDSGESGQKKGQDPILLNRKRVTERLRLVRNRLLDDYRFTQEISTRPVKVTLIGPDRIGQCYDSKNSRNVYAGVDDFLADVVRIEQQIVGQLADVGCRYIQIDGPGYTAYVDGPSLEAMRSRGEDPQANMERSIKADNEVIAGFPSVTFGLHMCRGNRQSMWHREGTYDSIAERLFNGLRHQRLLLEYDTERAGGFEPLRFIPKGKIAVLGLITTKAGRVEGVDDLRRRIDEAARYLPLDQLALSPQCGFASSIMGNLLSEDEQWRKLEVMMEAAEKIWGGGKG